MAHLLFTYGTLQKSFSNHYLIIGAEYLGSGKTLEKYSLYESGIPYVFKGEEVSHIHGELYRVERRLVQADFTGGDITSDGGAVVLREMDRRLQLTSAIAKRFSDTRRKKQIKHDYLSLLRQRVYGICLGYEDLNDHDSLRTDPLIQTALNKDYTLASPPTLCRFENSMGRE